jgi:hypothetical protein
MGENSTNENPLDLDAIEARAKAATPGPWRKQPRLSIDGSVESEAMGKGGVPAMMVDIDSERSRVDAEFIAHARKDVPDLVAEVRRLRAALDGSLKGLREAVDSANPYAVREWWYKNGGSR